MATMGAVELPVYMRVGDGEEHEVGTLSLDVAAESGGKPGESLTVTAAPEPFGPKLAALLREVADEVERQAGASVAVSGG